MAAIRYEQARHDYTLAYAPTCNKPFLKIPHSQGNCQPQLLRRDPVRVGVLERGTTLVDIYLGSLRWPP
jgi:hypothetical protein